MASEDWLTAFLKRNSNISIGTPAVNFNKENVNKFYENLATVLVHKPNKVLATKGVKQVGQIISQERGTLVTMCLAVNAMGNSVPPMFIFPLKKYHDHFILGGPTGSIGTANGSGWMKEEDFLIFIKHFANFSKPSENNRVLLILDNHHNLIYIFLSSNTAEITILHWPRFPVIPPIGFSHVFSEDDFAPSSVTDRPQTPSLSDNTDTDSNASEIALTQSEPGTNSIEADVCQPSTSGQNTRCNSPTLQKKAAFSPEGLRPLPKTDFSPLRKPARRKGKTAILTDTPVKELLEARYLAKKTLEGAKRKVLTDKKKRKPKSEKIGKMVDQIKDWLQCENCKQWAHYSCANNDPMFVCKNCVSEYSDNSE
ncbi:hypothetical protein NQ317_006690 [Molorchus minor]|uniref:DDE-1 domain-containing protein n=1 Tax=Molorchus minor TaxID=1323400 RepID=A0ABQ9JTB2_9CUCU|nr:hypothetical protein NQ317_006690 [Molorchus minor]